ncbi:MAG: prepilin-type N-terminal cleavage/methylation domain-containing protein [Gammaproteobacteria bacterium]|nr:prepilin-type N-terminal cleavage/methylation domain-containing protein [Gammaproteobacteria bacterium]
MALYIACMDKRQQTGFTLYELMITVMVVAVILTFGIPNLRQYTLNSRMTGTANDLHAAFMMARTEAAHAKSNVTICASADPTGTGTCDGTWNQGYVVFIDNDADRARGAGEAILRTHPPADNGVLLRVANNATYFMYAPSGLGRRDTANNTPVSQVVICDERGNIRAAGGNSAARLFVSTPLGRATVVRDRTLIQAALDSPQMMGATCP